MNNRITYNPKIFAGKPTIKGTRISVEFILELLASGMTPEEIVKEYPQLNKRDIWAVLDYAAKIIKKEELIPV
ncbi:MAG: antitoxin [Candidatus Nealsonbacteria bacterium CG_4_10_14_0_8_um_filter_35_10]|uniref:Antitoxin n=2 Tax=Candidatus Nealsoniibacteriota TaxID=1817911 RepID=A0A2M7R851_9BACT|nr:MAG: antitoxin [Parcubacteria group bacterium CG1_02_36_42]PIY90976.1 MAG: antitoxin [Candidatus Nealsonbacteria bacterium CG_4_10_14_0_8_um_filter_35_10]PJB99346.1 MAG: antitoxin [Candidatus Nealsonbacteria bacterium CG_4_9_14_0_8_um_filter_35_12]